MARLSTRESGRGGGGTRAIPSGAHMADENQRCAPLRRLSGLRIELGHAADAPRLPRRKLLLRALPNGARRIIPTWRPVRELRRAGSMSRNLDFAQHRQDEPRRSRVRSERTAKISHVDGGGRAIGAHSVRPCKGFLRRRPDAGMGRRPEFGDLYIDGVEWRDWRRRRMESRKPKATPGDVKK